jgi:acyl-CoA hydrolase
MVDLLKARREGRANFLFVGQVSSELPFMPGDGEISAEEFHAVLDAPEYDFPLFAPPKEPIDLHEYAAGFHVARLVPDGGTLQIGIGQEGDAAAHALILRHRENAAFQEAIRALAPAETNPVSLEREPFAKGLYASTEMLVDSFIALIDAGVLKREVDGVLIHGGFFLGPKDFYRRLREMPPEQLHKIQMTAVSFTNQLYGDEEKKRAARVGARFVNNAMMATLIGAVISDGLEDGRVVSGVGGQYNFVEQAFALPDARSVIVLNATRSSGGNVTSNIRWSYGHETIPRHLRDIVVSEYGIADLRGKSDQDVIAAMLSITDSRFQPELMRAAKDAGKLPRAYEIPAAHRENSPETIERLLKPLADRGLLPAFPFGTDFTPTEQRLLPALSLLKESSRFQLAGLVMSGVFARDVQGGRDALQRMGFDNPTTIAERIYGLLLRAALAHTAGN